MLTLHPVVLRGRTGLALPAQEFAARVAGVRAALVARGIDALVAYGDARSYAPLAWVTGLVPMLKWALAVVPAGDGLPVSLYVAMPGARDLPALRRLAAADGVAPAAALPAALAGLRVVALAGLRAIRASSEDAVRGAVAEVADGDELLAPLMSRTSAAEGALLSAAASAAADTADVVLRSFAAGARCSDALLDGDLAARLAGVHDVRLLWSPDGGRTLRPLEGIVEARPEPFAFLIAVETGGYWGEALRSSGPCASLPAGLSAVARMGLEIVEGADPWRSPGVHSIRELDAGGAWSSRTVEAP